MTPDRAVRRARFALPLLLLFVVAACGPAATASPAGPASPVDGVVLTIDASGLSEVHGFTLRTAAGQTYTFSIGNLENPTAFPPGHLAEHQANALPVRVYFVPGPQGLVAYRIEDAPRISPAA